MTSLPWPRHAAIPAALGDAKTTLIPLGRWPGSEHPRRLLLIADGENRAPEQLKVAPFSSAAKGNTPPSATMPQIAASTDEWFPWESHALRIEHGGRSLEILLGLRRADGVHWWENCRLTTESESPLCRSIEMGGVIPLIRDGFDEVRASPGFTYPLLHKHNWLNGHIHARLHVNGVCEFFVRHVNSRFVDDGGDLEDAVPVVGFRVDAGQEQFAELEGTWSGAQNTFSLGGVAFDLSEPARLASERHPGRFDVEEETLVWQPYEGVEIYGGVCPEALTSDPFINRPEQKVFPRGLARTLRFSVSLSDRSPRIAHYAAPAWWHGVCEDFLPEPLLPASDAFDSSLTEARNWIRNFTQQGGFEDGAVARLDNEPREEDGRTHHEAGWEGDTPYAQFLSAWRTGNAEEYFAALRSAYHFVDVVIDHAAKVGRMHGFAATKLSLPMTRMPGVIAAYLETGDPFLKTTAESATANAYWLHKNSWPRQAVGRDSCYLRSAVLLYRYFGSEFFREIARDGASDVISVQQENGSFGDQGGGARIHGWGAYIIKPWMGLLSLGGVLDYLELFPDEPELTAGVLRFADWLMSERVSYAKGRSWCFQHEFNGKRIFQHLTSGAMVELPDRKMQWHHETLARLLTFASLKTGDPAYFEAWLESREVKETPLNLDHMANAILQFIPWVQAKLWNARLTPQGVVAEPRFVSSLQPGSARIYAPEGMVDVVLDSQEVVAPEKMETATTGI